MATSAKIGIMFDVTRRFRFPLFFLLFAISAVSLYLGAQSTIVNELTTSLKDAAEYETYLKFMSRFGEAENLFVAFPVPAIDREGLLQLHRTENLLRETDGVEKTLSVLSLLPSRAFKDMEQYLQNRANLDALEKSLTYNTFFRDNLVAQDMKSLGILVTIRFREDPARKLQLVRDINRKLAVLFKDGPCYTAGYPVHDERYMTLVRENTLKFSLLSIVCGMLLLYIIFRDFKIVAGTSVVAVLPVTWTFAIISLISGRLNGLTTLLIPLVLSISLSISMRIITEALSNTRKTGDVEQAVRNAAISLFRPAVLCGLTTFLGFISLCLSKVQVVSEFGIFAATGSLLATAAAYLFTPQVLVYCLAERNPEAKRPARSGLKRLVRRTLSLLLKTVLKHPKPLLAALAAVVVLSVWSLSGLKLGSSSLRAFTRDDPVTVATSYINEHFAGIYSINVWLYNAEADFHDLSLLERIELFQKELAQKPGVMKTFSVVDLYKDFNYSINKRQRSLPASEGELASVTSYYKSKQPETFSYFMSEFNDEVNILVRVDKPYAFFVLDLAGSIRKLLGERFPASIKPVITGKLYLASLINVYTVKMELVSFLGALASIIVIITVVFFSLPLGGISFIVNIVPIAFAYGLMSLLRFPLDVTTGTVAAVTIGLIVDDTIHFIDTYTGELKRGGWRRAVKKTILRVGEPVCYTSIILVLSLLVLLGGNFNPTVYFGLFSAITLAFALVCDIVFLPVLLKFIHGSR